MLFMYDLLEGVERLADDVLLVDLVGHEEQVVFVRELHDFLHVLPRQHLEPIQQPDSCQAVAICIVSCIEFHSKLSY